MEKEYYNEKNYLSGDEESINTIIKLKNEYALLYAIEEIKYGDLLKMYNRFLRMVKELLQTLDLDNSLEYSIAVAYLINNGFLTFDKEFKNIETKKEIHTRYGTTIVKGFGVCRNYSDLNKDIMTLLDYYVKNIYCFCPYLGLPKNARNKKSNHVVNMIEYSDVKYGIDLFNNCNLYHFKTPFILDRITTGPTRQMRYKPYFEVIVGESDFKDIPDQIREYSQESKKIELSAEEYEDGIRNKTNDYLSKHNDLFEDFHNETKEMKIEMVRMMRQ